MKPAAWIAATPCLNRDVPMPSIEEQYNARIDAMTPRERIARSWAMFDWIREAIGRDIQRQQIEATGHPFSEAELKWQIALRMYGSEPAVVELIQRSRQNVSS